MVFDLDSFMGNDPTVGKEPEQQPKSLMDMLGAEPTPLSPAEQAAADLRAAELALQQPDPMANKEKRSATTKRDRLLFVIDTSAVLWTYYKARCYNCGPGECISSHDGKSIDTLYAIFSFLYACKRAKGKPLDSTDRFVFALDSRVNHRKQEDASYKANRENSANALEETAQEQIELALNILTQSGFMLRGAYGAEGDDIVATVVHNHKREFDHVFIIGKDKDLFCLVDENVSLVPMNQKEQIMTIDNWEVLASQRLKTFVPYPLSTLALTLLGDKSDNIPHKKGFGPSGFSWLLQRMLEVYTPNEIAGHELHVIKEFVDADHYAIAEDAYKKVKLRHYSGITIDQSAQHDFDLFHQAIKPMTALRYLFSQYEHE